MTKLVIRDLELLETLDHLSMQRNKGGAVVGRAIVQHSWDYRAPVPERAQLEFLTLLSI